MHIVNIEEHSVWSLWGKADPQIAAQAAARGEPAAEWHPLLCHLVDVASVARRMLERVLPGSVLRRMSGAMGLTREHALAWICFWVALHDLGKASPAFQAKWQPGQDRLVPLGLDFRAPKDAKHHGVVTMALGPVMLEQRFGLPRDVSRRALRAVAAHHGDFPRDNELSSARAPQQAGNARWDEARDALVDALARLYEIGGRPPPAPALARDHAFFLLLAGLTAVADWIGSMAEIFRYRPDVRSLDTYATEAATLAERALSHVGYRDLVSSGGARSFSDLFPGHAPWPLHRTTEAMAMDLRGPSLLVIEAPMGEGKTEAALLAAEHLRHAADNDGLFVGLPTQATSNQMFRRVEQYLGRTQGGVRTNLHLVHGQSALVADYEALRARAIYDRNGTRAESVVAEGWFARPKRALLSGFAVGTVDQALLGVLRTRHGFVRLFGAAGKTVVLDEVHAYDTYTSELIYRLVAWLGALGASVVLLSATLPRKRRAELVQAFGGEDVAPPGAAPYPRITCVSGGSAREVPTGCWRAAVAVSLESVGPDCGAVAEALAGLLDGGGCAAWICNTVARAQDAYRALRALRDRGALPPDTELGLLHARFPFEDRLRREMAAERAFGRKGDRPRRAILVGTQVLEQSLDLDFDVMISDYAPVDLLLQRSGRLHRHAREGRPPKLASPRLLLVQPEHVDRPEGPSFAAVAPKQVYEELVMLRTWLALRGRSGWMLPDDMEALIEEVYGDGGLPDGLATQIRRRVEAAAERFEASKEEDEGSAQVKLIPSPRETDDPFANLSMPYQNEDPALHESLQARTRLGGPSVDVVCLFETPKGPALDRAGDSPVDLAAEPDRGMAKKLLGRSVGIAHRGLVDALLRSEVPDGWSNSPYLRNHRPMVFAEDPIRIDGWEIVLDEELGVVIHRGRTSHE